MTISPLPDTGEAPARTAPTPPDRATPAPAPAGPVYLVAGGDLVALFDSRAEADIMITTLLAANLDPVTACLTATWWDEVRAGLLACVPAVTITDTRSNHPGGIR